MTQIHEGMVAGDVLMQHPSTINVFERLGIPMGMHNATLAEVCTAQGVRPALLISLLHVTIDHSPNMQEHLQTDDIPILVNFLLCSHDYFSQEATPSIQRSFDQVLDDAGDGSGNLLKKFFSNYKREVERHFAYERDVAFPYMIQLAQPPPSDATREQKRYSVKEYKRQHSDIEDALLDLKSLLIKFLPTSQEYALRRKIFLDIATLGEDLNIHTCIEDQILIPLVEREEQRWYK